MCMASSVEGVMVVHERVDIEDGEYRGWDANGCPVRLWWAQGQGVQVETLEEPCRPDQLRDAIVQYARLSGVSDVLAQPDVPTEPAELFVQVERRIGERNPGLLKRLERVLRRADSG